MNEEVRFDRRAVVAIAATIIAIALVYLVRHDRTFVHIDAIAHVNKARGLWDNTTPGLRQLGSSRLPLPSFLIFPLTFSDGLWVTGLAGSIVSAVCFVGTGWFLYGIGFRWTGFRSAGWLSFLLFAANPRTVYLFTTPMTEPLMVLWAAGLVYYLMEYVQSDEWRPFAMACLMAFAGTLTGYEGWAIAAAVIPVVFAVSETRRLAKTILFAGAAALGPMLWMIYNMVYFEDPLIFAWGRGSAFDYAQEYFFRTGKQFPAAGSFFESLKTYWTDVAYCVNPLVLWFAVAAICMTWLACRWGQWRTTTIVVTIAVVPFFFYTCSLYTNIVPIQLPGLVQDEPEAIYNVRYGAVMLAVFPALAAFAVHIAFRQVERKRIFALSFVSALFLPNPIPDASDESPPLQLTNNLFYLESVHNQSFWMPPFVEIATRLETDIAESHDSNGLILTNSRIVHVAVWTTGIHMRRFIQETNKTRWDTNLNGIDPGIRWVITEEGDHLWHAQGRNLQRNWIEVASARTPSTGVVHLYRRP